MTLSTPRSILRTQRGEQRRNRRTNKESSLEIIRYLTEKYRGDSLKRHETKKSCAKNALKQNVSCEIPTALRQSIMVLLRSKGSPQPRRKLQTAVHQVRDHTSPGARRCYSKVSRPSSPTHLPPISLYRFCMSMRSGSLLISFFEYPNSSLSLAL